METAAEFVFRPEIPLDFYNYARHAFPSLLYPLGFLYAARGVGVTFADGDLRVTRGRYLRRYTFNI